MALGLLAALPQAPGETAPNDDEKPRPVDTDGVIPYRLECDLKGNWGGRHYGHWETVDGKVIMESEVALNWCRLAMQGAGPMDVHRILEHERAHARGWRHYEGDQSVNAAYDPRAIRITGF